MSRHNIDLRPLSPASAASPASPVRLAEGLTVTPLTVPHRDELSDTLGFIVRGPRRTLLYVPDTDSWSAWPRPLDAVLRAEHVDVALLDGTFYDAAELPDRDVRKIGHPLMTDTMALLHAAVQAGAVEVQFTHLNHSNPTLDPASPQRRAVEAAGFHVLSEGQEIDL